MPTAITPVLVTPGVTGWTDVNIAAHVGVHAGDVSGAILHVANQTGSAQAVGFRPNGSTSTRTRNMANNWQAYHTVLVDGNDIFEANVANTGVEIYLIGYLTTAEYDGLINEVEVTPTTDDTYQTINISSHVGTDTPTGAILGMDNSCGSTHPDFYIRASGATEDFAFRCFAQTNQMAVVKLNSSYEFEARIQNACGHVYLQGWIKDNCNFKTTIVEHNPTALDTYETFDLSSEVDANAVGIFWVSNGGDDFPGTRAIKEAGSSYGDEFYLATEATAWGFTKLPANKSVSIKSTDPDFQESVAVVADVLEPADTGSTTVVIDEVNSVGNTEGAFTASMSLAVTVPAGTSHVVIDVGYRDGGGAGINTSVSSDLDGALTEVVSQNAPSGGGHHSHQWVLAAPSEGTHNFTAAWTGGTGGDRSMHAWVISGASAVLNAGGNSDGATSDPNLNITTTDLNSVVLISASAPGGETSLTALPSHYSQFARYPTGTATNNADRSHFEINGTEVSARTRNVAWEWVNTPNFPWVASAVEVVGTGESGGGVEVTEAPAGEALQLVSGTPTLGAIIDDGDIEVAVDPNGDVLQLVGNTPTIDVVNDSPAVPGDPHFANVTLLAHFDGDDGALSSVDSSNNGLSLVHEQGAVLDTGDFKFGSASLQQSGTSTLMKASIAGSEAIGAFGSDPFTIEVSAKWDGTTSTSQDIGYLIAQTGVFDDYGWFFGFNRATESLIFTYSPDGTFANLTTISIAFDMGSTNFRTLAVDRDDLGTLRIYADGAMLTSASVPTIYDPVEEMAVGNTAASAGVWLGWIDEVRITKGVARYASDSGYTPATEAFPDSSSNPGIVTVDPALEQLVLVTKAPTLSIINKIRISETPAGETIELRTGQPQITVIDGQDIVVTTDPAGEILQLKSGTPEIRYRVTVRQAPASESIELSPGTPEIIALDVGEIAVLPAGEILNISLGTPEIIAQVAAFVDPAVSVLSLVGNTPDVIATGGKLPRTENPTYGQIQLIAGTPSTHVVLSEWVQSLPAEDIWTKVTEDTEIWTDITNASSSWTKY